MKKLDMKPNGTKGFLFTFCGLDGCGKTTMLTRLKSDLESEPGALKMMTGFMKLQGRS